MIAINYLKCIQCDGHGYISEETTGNFAPYEQHYIDLQCDECNGKGQIIDLDEMLYRSESRHDVYYENELGFIADADELINGLQKRKEMVLYSIVTLKQMGLHSELSRKWHDRLDTINRGIERVKNYRQILSTYETNI